MNASASLQGGAARFVHIIRDTIRRGGQFGLSETGAEAFARQLEAGAPFVPAIVMNGSLQNWNDLIVHRALRAIEDAAEEKDALKAVDDMVTVQQADAMYVLGLLVGAEIAGGAR
jgi:hypothetical protein